MPGINILTSSAAIMGIATRSRGIFKRLDKIFIDDKNSCVHTSKKQTISLPKDVLNQINDGDLIQLLSDRELKILYKNGEDDYTVFMTNSCNSSCVMCPQCPENDDVEITGNAILAMNLIPSHVLKQIGITGGEPTLFVHELCHILNIAQCKHPKARVFLLTNGRLLNDFAIAKQISQRNQKISFCIPLYAPTDDLHDKIVGVDGAFVETIHGIHNLFRLGQHLEVRIVLISPTISTLTLLSSFIFRNFPFIGHVAFMGAEYIGEAEKNLDSLWIDPCEYMFELGEAVLYLHRRDMDVSIYNIPLCLLPEKLWVFSRDSISSWKKSFLPICSTCCQQKNCGGLFATSRMQSKAIHPI
jgi:His-Xaa-Ser system radical SAM maturase HxsC